MMSSFIAVADSGVLAHGLTVVQMHLLCVVDPVMRRQFATSESTRQSFFLQRE